MTNELTSDKDLGPGSGLQAARVGEGQLKPSFVELLRSLGTRSTEPSSLRARARADERRAALWVIAVARTRSLLVWLIAGACTVWIAVSILPATPIAFLSDKPVAEVSPAPAVVIATAPAPVVQAPAVPAQAAQAPAAPVRASQPPISPTTVAEVPVSPNPIVQAPAAQSQAARTPAEPVQAADAHASSAAVAETSTSPAPVVQVPTALTQAAPAQATPAQATPAQATPVQAGPAQAAPAQATPAQAAPAQAVPAQAAPAEAAPAEAAPAEATPAQAATIETTPAQAAPVQVAPAQAVTIETVPAQAVPGPSAPAPSAAASTSSSNAPDERPAKPTPGVSMNEPAPSSSRETIAQTALTNAEVREIQTMLLSFGFDPGPIDGATGSRTQDAAVHYRQSRSLANTNAIDRRLLEALRSDPAPSAKVARSAPAQQPAPSQPRDSLLPVAIPSADVREIQTLLQGTGFDPGPIDGAVGSKTQEAIARYRQSRGETGTKTIDHGLLETLRRDSPRQTMGPPGADARQSTTSVEAFHDEFGFRYDAQGNRIDRNGHIINPPGSKQ